MYYNHLKRSGKLQNKSMEFYRTYLSTEESETYSIILSGLQNRMDVIAIPLTPSEAVNSIFRSILADHPELAWTTGQWKGKPDNTDIVYPLYNLTENESNVFIENLRYIKDAVKTLHHLPETDRVWIIYNRMLNMCTYDPKAPHSQSAYGSLIDRHAVCRGLSKGFTLMMDAAGISSITVEGTLDGKTLHVWNIVMIDGMNYHVDVSMGYSKFKFLYTEKGLQYDKLSAFCVSDMTLRKTHRWDPKVVPLKCEKDI